MMNPIRRKIPNIDPRMAFTTMPAAPNFSTALKVDPITQSETGFRLVVSANLAGDISRHILCGGKLIAQAGTPGVGGEAADLIDLGKILAANRIENIAGQIAPQRKPEPSPSRCHPLRRTADKTCARSRNGDGQRPGAGKISQIVAGKSFPGRESSDFQIVSRGRTRRKLLK